MLARIRVVLSGALIVLSPAAALAQAGGAVAQGDPAASEARAATAGLITPDVIRSWNRIGQNVLSNDGRWFAYLLTPNEGDATVVYRGTDRNARETRVNVGEDGGSIAMSEDSKWLGFIVAPPKPPEGERAGRGERNADADADSAAPPRQTANRFVLVSLATGESKEFERIRRFSFNGKNATWVAMMGYGTPETPAAGSGRGATRGQAGSGGGNQGGGGGSAAPLLLYSLTTGELFNMGVVGDYAFDEDGRWLAWTMATPDRVGNGVQLRDMRTNVVRSLESDRLLYSHLAWVDSSRAISVMRGHIDRESSDTVFSIRVFRNISERGAGRTLTFDPAATESFPDGHKLASERAPQYADDMSAVYFGIRQVEDKEPPDNGVRPGAPGMGGRIEELVGANRRNGEEADTALPSLILWHHRDARLQSQQIVQEERDRSFNYFSAYRFENGRFMQLADDVVRSVTVMPGDRWAYGTSNEEYQQVASYSGRNYMDVYRFDLRSGQRTLLMKGRPSGSLSASPDGRNLLFWGVDGHYWVLDMASGDSVNITQNVPVRFVDAEDDHNNIYPRALPSRGWAKDGSAVLLYDDWDIWKVPVRPGERAVNLTGDGREKQIRYQRIYDFSDDEGSGGGFRGFGGSSSDGIDLTKPLWFGMYGEWTKMEGLARVDPGQPGAKVLFFEPARFSVQKARAADTFIYTRQTFTEFPDYWVANDDFRGGYRITEANPQLENLAWSSGARLIEYTTDRGVKLQGALYLPANYEEGKKYPLLVTIYEKRSQNLNSFISPSETRTPDPSQYTNRGYAVLDPDIVYEINDPGMSAVWAVIPAVKAAIATGIVDEERVGLWGHSWGGYQTAFLVTQTDIFTAAVAGAPLTDMVSMYSSVYWNTGGANQAIFEASQGRFKGNFIDNYDAYIRNSPAFHADNVTTPLIILHNEKDGAVDFNQGITYFNTLRQLGKEVILLQYVGENHGLRVEANQKDYATRMSEWFDHYLLGSPAPDWMKNGVPRLEIEEHLRSRIASPRTVTTTTNDNNDH